MTPFGTPVPSPSSAYLPMSPRPKTPDDPEWVDLFGDEREAWAMVREHMGKPMWWQRRFLTKRQRWLIHYFEGRMTSV